MEQLLRYFMAETNKRFDEIGLRFDGVSEKIDGLQKFKIETIASARWVSLVVSGICGFITMVVSAYVTSKIGK